MMIVTAMVLKRVTIVVLELEGYGIVKIIWS
jgi:hypothetical protein